MGMSYFLSIKKYDIKKIDNQVEFVNKSPQYPHKLRRKYSLRWVFQSDQ